MIMKPAYADNANAVDCWLGKREDGSEVWVPVPRNCHCSEPAVYGDPPRWYCSECWQTLKK